MPNQWGDTEVQDAPVVNQFGDEAVSAPQFQLPEIAPFIRPTNPVVPESAGPSLETPIPISVTESERDIPAVFQQAPIGQVFNDERHGLIRKISQTNYEKVKPGFLRDIADVIAGTPTAIMHTSLSPIEDPLRRILESPDVRAMGASIGSSIAGARAGAPFGPYGMMIGGIGGAALAEPYVQSQIPSTGTESVLRVASGGLNSPMQVFDKLALKTGPRVATALEQGLIGAGIGETQVVGNALEQGRLPTGEELVKAPIVGGFAGATVGGLIGGQRATPLAEPTIAEPFVPSPVKPVIPEPVVAEAAAPVAPAPRGVVRPPNAGTSFVEPEANRVGRAMMDIPGEPIKPVAGQPVSSPVNSFGDTAVSTAIEEVTARMNAAPTAAQKLAILKQEVQLRSDTLTPAEERIALDTQQKLENQVAVEKATQEKQQIEIDNAEAIDKAAAEQQKAAQKAQAEQEKALQQQQQPLLEPKPQNLANTSAQTASMAKKGDNVTLQASLNTISGSKLPEPVAPVDIGPRDASVSTGTGVPTPKETAMLAEQRKLLGLEPEGTVPAGITVKRSKDFARDGTYDVSNGDKTVQIYRDPENGWWYFTPEGSNKHYTELVAGFSKKEATAAAQQRLTAESLPVSPKAPQAMAVYRTLPETNDGLYVSADLIRPHVPGYDINNPTVTHGSASDIADNVFREGLVRPDVESVLFLAGGAGSGKSMAMRGGMPKGALVYDGTFSSSKSMGRLKEAIDSGKPVNIVYIHRNLEDAYLSMLARGEAGQQPIVPDAAFVNGHLNSRKNFIKAFEKYHANPNVQFSVIDNTIQGAAAKTVDNPAAFLKRAGKNSPSNEQATQIVERLKANRPPVPQNPATGSGQLESQPIQTQEGLTDIVPGKPAPFLEPVAPAQAGTVSHRITDKDSQEIQHKLGILLEGDDLLESYGLTKEQAQELYDTIPTSGGEWKIPVWAKNVVAGELDDHANILRGMASDARSENLRGQALAEERRAIRMENIASSLRSERGSISPRLIAPLTGATVGGTGGFLATEQQPGESDAAFQARRLTNTLGAAGAGLIGGSGIASLSKIRLNRAPATSNPSLSAVRKILSPANQAKKGMFETVKDASFDFMTRVNTAWAPLEKLQRNVYKLVNRPFQAGSYYDLADRGESLAGAVVHAQREAGLLADLVNNLPKPLRARLPEYLVLSRIKDRLERIPVEAASLQDAVGMAEAELAAAKSKFTESKTLVNAQAVNNRKEDLRKSITALNEEADRLRVAGWSLDDPAKNNPSTGLAALQAEVGPEGFAAMQKAGQDFQSLMLENLRRQVDSGRMPQSVFDQITDSSDFYAPFKVMKHYEESTAPVYSGGGRSAVNIQPITKRITGIDDTELKLANPLEPAFEQIYKGTLLAEKNKFLREVSTLTSLDKEGQYIKILKPDEPVRKGFKEVPFLRNGDVVRMEVAEDVHEALTSPMSWAEKSIVLNSLRAGSTLFKMGATALQAPFQIKNAFIFDPTRLAVMSKYGIRNPVDAASFIFRDYPAGMWSAFRTSVGHPDELGEKWLSSGAANSTFARVLNPAAFAKTLPTEESAAKVIWKNQFGLVPLNNAASILSSALEQSAKITGLKRALRFENLDELNPVEKQRRWREVVHELRNYAGSPDFNRMGTDMGIINVLMPFTNARWQGFVADAGRLVGNDKAGIAAKTRLATMIGLPAAGLMMWNLRPENRKDWEQIPENERMRGFYIPVYQSKAGEMTLLPSNSDGTQNAPKYFKDRQGRNLRQYYVLPKREVPQLMGNATEDFVRWLETEDPDSFNGLGSTLLNVAAPISLNGRNATEMGQSALSGVNPVLRTPMEVALNRDMWRQKDIIPQSRLGALQTRPDLAASPNTPDFYKDIAGMVPDFAPSIMRSPAVVQKVLEDMTGGFPRQFINPKDKPDQSFGERVTRGFRRSENVDLTDAENAMDVAKGASIAQRAAATDKAEAIVKFITDTNDPARASAVIQQGIKTGDINKETYDEIVLRLREQSMGYTPEQSQVSRLSKRERAFFFHERLKSLKPEEAQAYINDAIAKRLIDRDVGAMMMQLK